MEWVEPIFEKLSDLAYEIVASTFDDHCCSVDDLIVGDKTVEVVYEYHCRGEYGHKSVHVPLEWFDEDYDYATAFKELKWKEAEEEKKRIEAERRRKAAAERRAAVKKASKELETYLKLKQKYEDQMKKANGRK